MSAPDPAAPVGLDLEPWKGDFAPFTDRELLLMAYVARDWRDLMSRQQAMLHKHQWSAAAPEGADGADACPECGAVVYWTKLGNAPSIQHGDHFEGCALRSLLPREPK